MTKDSLKLISLQIELQRLITEREAMLQGNRERESQGYSPMYDSDVFFELANNFNSLHGYIPKDLQHEK